MGLAHNLNLIFKCAKSEMFIFSEPVLFTLFKMYNLFRARIRETRRVNWDLAVCVLVLCVFETCFVLCVVGGCEVISSFEEDCPRGLR